MEGGGEQVEQIEERSILIGGGEMIESRSNTQIKKIQKLKKQAKFRRQEQVFLVEGFKMTEEALRNGRVRTIYVAEDARTEMEEKLPRVPGEIPVLPVAPSVFRELADTTTPQGVMAIVEMPSYDRTTLVEQKEAALICLEDIRDPGNLGTIFRTAEGAGMTAVVLSGGCVDLFNPKVVRATMGALFRQPFYQVEDMAEEVRRLRDSGFSIYAAAPGAGQDYTACCYEGRTGILIGNEANGLCQETLALANERIRIPMEGELESLNAAVSAALLMYEVHRKQ